MREYFGESFKRWVFSGYRLLGTAPDRYSSCQPTHSSFAACLDEAAAPRHTRNPPPLVSRVATFARSSRNDRATLFFVPRFSAKCRTNCF